MKIDTSFDFQTDAFGKDPDKYSSTLRRYHRLLWSKPLPSGSPFVLHDAAPKAYLHHRSALGEFHLSSDSVIPTFTRWKALQPIIQLFPKEENEAFRTTSYTIGGMMVFPGNKINGKMTINGARGCSSKIADRMDITLECIRRYYLSERSPLYETLHRYNDFFSLFDNFAGYVDFFMLQDLVSVDYSTVNFFIPFDDFNAKAVPTSDDIYREYRRLSIAFVEARNGRIGRYAASALR
jgi:hypothetical protein